MAVFVVVYDFFGFPGGCKLHVPCLCVPDVHGVFVNLAVGTVIALLEDWGGCGKLPGAAGCSCDSGTVDEFLGAEGVVCTMAARA
jgi:hypothetical protein